MKRADFSGRFLTININILNVFLICCNLNYSFANLPRLCVEA